VSARPIGVAVIGLGFMGRAHLAAYRAADAAGFPNRLVAACDRSPERRRGIPSAAGNLKAGGEGERMFDPALVRGCERPEDVLADPEVELVSICTPTPTHVELALAALEAGKHVLVEKPVALASGDVVRLAAAARSARTLCMPAMCIRFWPAWAWLRARIASGELGQVESAVFRRLGRRPDWSSEFYGDASASGGALFDLHVHDADFVRACFGDPASVASAGSSEHVTTLYHYDRGPRHVVAEGGWDHARGWPFHMGFTVVFEGGTADCASGRADELVLYRDGGRERIELEPLTGYDGEVRHLLAAIATGSRRLDATIDDALAHTRLLEAERESLETRSAVALASRRA
jgi:predicted dehydrogenase